MADARSCKHACIHVSPSQTLLIIISAVVLLASMLSVAAAVAAEPPSGGYRFELTHVDAHGNFTKDELISRAAERSRLRGRRGAATTSSAALLGAHTPSHSGVETPIRSPVHYSNYEYLMEVTIHEQKYHAIVDTGSSLIWMLKPPRNPMSSISLDRCHRRLSCGDSLCAGSKCEPGGGCSYDITYADGFHTWGPMCRETLQFLRPGLEIRPISIDDIAIGWSEPAATITNRAKNYNGTVGLGRGEQSLVKQLKVHNFSYCLTTYYKSKLKSPLLLGSPDALKDKDSCNDNRCKVQTTPLLQNTTHTSAYYVHLEYIEIGGKRTDLPKPPKEEGATPTGSSEEAPNMFIDSGATFTVLEKTAHKALLDHVNEAMNKDAKKVGSTFCWSDKTDLPEFPDLELHFAGGAVMYLHKDKVMYKDETPNKDDGLPQVCLAIESADDPKNKDGGPILGNYQQQNIHMHFDVAKKKLSFVKVDDCTKA